MKEAGLDQTRPLSWRVCPGPTRASSFPRGCKVDVCSAHHVEFHGVRCASAGVTRKKRNARESAKCLDERTSNMKHCVRQKKLSAGSDTLSLRVSLLPNQVPSERSPPSPIPSSLVSHYLPLPAPLWRACNANASF